MRVGWILVAGMLVGCASSADEARAPADGSLEAGASAAAVEARIDQLVNAHRKSSGLGALVPNPKVAAIARRHSERMAKGVVPVGHDGFDGRTQEIYALVASSTRVGENVSRHRGRDLEEVPEAAMEAWLDSPVHRRNIEKPPFNVSGVGLAVGADGTVYVTQLFVGVE